MKTRFNRHSLVAGAFLFSASLSALATNHDPTTTGGGCRPCQENQGVGGAPAGTSNGSVDISLRIGRSRVDRPADFRGSFAVAGQNEGNSAKPQGLDANVDAYEGRGVEALWPVELRLESDVIDAALFDPASLEDEHDSHVEYVRVGGVIRQTLSDDYLVDIEVLPAGQEGYIARWYAAAGVSFNSGTGLYEPAAGAAVVKSVTIENPTPGTYTHCHVLQQTMLPGGTQYKTTGTVYHFYTDGQGQPVHLMETYDRDPADTAAVLLESDELAFTAGAPGDHDRTERRIVKRASLAADGSYGALQTVADDVTDYDDFGGSPRIVNRTVAPDSASPQTTHYTYYNDPSQPVLHGRMASETNPDGSSKVYQYSTGTTADVQTEYTTFKDSVSVVDKKIRTVTLTEDSMTEIVQLQGQTVAKTETTHLVGSAGERIVRTVRFNGTEEHTGLKAYYSQADSSDPKAGRIIWSKNSDGTATTYSYTFNGGDMTVTMDSGAAAATVQEIDAPVVPSGSRTVSVYNSFREVVEQTNYDLDGGLATALDSWTGTDIDIYGRPQKKVYNGNPSDYSETIYGCCGVEQTRDRSGATSVYFKDHLQRVYRRVDTAGTRSVATTTAYDGLTTTVHRVAGSDVLLVSETTRSLNGLTMSYKYPDADGDGIAETGGSVTVHNAGGGSTTTRTAADGSTTVTVTYRDGSTKSTTDEAGNTTTHDKGVHSIGDGGLYSLVTAPNGTQSTKVYMDRLGRTFRTENAGGSYSEMSYYPQTAAAGARGKLHVTRDADETASAGSGSHTTYGYNAEGDRTSITTELPGSQQLVQTMDYDVVTDATLGVCLRTRSYTNGVLVSTSLRSADGYSSKTTTLAGTSTATRSVASNGSWTVTGVAADGTQQRQYYVDGLMASAVSFESGSTLPASAPADITAVTDTGFITGSSSTYDGFGRPATRTDARTGTVTYDSYLENGALVSMTDAGSRTTSYGYDKTGRTVQVNAPDTLDGNGNTLANITYTSYYPTGQVKATWGDQTYARFNVYDGLNRLAELRTYQNLAHGTEPTSATTGYASTQWIYDGQRGWLVEKNYDGETDDGATDPDYTYTAAGRLLTRTWERGITTTYSYEDGMLTGVSYSDGTTPGVAYTYDGYGRVATVTQGTGSTQNVHTYAYDANTLQLDTETVSHSNGALVRTLDRHQDSLLRPAGYELKNGSTVETAASYGYDNAGRLYQVGTSYPLPASPQFTYGYLAKSGSMVESVDGPVHTVTNSYASDRNVLSRKQNEDKAATPVTISDFTYAVNALGQRTGQTTAGSAFSSGFVRSFGYDAKGQVVSDNHDTNNTFDRTYSFDGIGNRTTATEDTTTVNYTANSKNQYSAVGSNSYTYDVDGNLTDDGTYKYIYDAENRLIKTTNQSGTTLGLYGYDYLSRRITRFKATSTQTFGYVYDGWNLIAEYYTSNYNFNKAFTWGQDLSGTMQGAGGVGGLLRIKDAGLSVFYPLYDGNGNVSEYLNGSRTVVAHYEYDAFGNSVVKTGSQADYFGFRFSTKRITPEVNLYYYGYRYYAPETGRWINRDPIEEKGGFNIYGFVGNDGVNAWDYLGMANCTDGECQIHLKHYNDITLNICLTDALGEEHCMQTPNVLSAIPDIDEETAANILESLGGKITRTILVKLFVKNVLAKSFISGLSKAIKLPSNKVIALQMVSMRIYIQADAVHKICKCKSGEWGSWDWFNQETKNIQFDLAKGNLGLGADDAIAGKLIGSKGFVLGAKRIINEIKMDGMRDYVISRIKEDRGCK